MPQGPTNQLHSPSSKHDIHLENINKSSPVSSSMDVKLPSDVRTTDITALHECSIQIIDHRFDYHTMVQPEFCINTEVVFTCKQYSNLWFTSTWDTWRSYDEFRVLDLQIRKSFGKVMEDIPFAKPHKRRTFFGLSKTQSFQKLRQAELDVYMQHITKSPEMRLLRFTDVRAPPFLRFFCNFQSGFGMNLQHKLLNNSNGKCTPPPSGIPVDVIDADFIDEYGRNMTACAKYRCSCHPSFQSKLSRMRKVLKSHALSVVDVPLIGPSGLHCLVWEFHKARILSKKFYADDGKAGKSTPGMKGIRMMLGAEQLRNDIVVYGLLNAEVLAKCFGMNVIDLKKKFHAFRKKSNNRVGPVELLTACTMFNMSIRLFTNDKSKSVQHLDPLEGVRKLRSKPILVISLGFMLPTSRCYNGHYVCTKSTSNNQNYESQNEIEVSSSLPYSSKWKIKSKLLELVHRNMAGKDVEIKKGKDAEDLQQAILDAVWDASGHNPNRMMVFQAHAKLFGRSYSTGEEFFQFLVKEFSRTGAEYITDFLIHVLPIQEKRSCLLSIRWSTLIKELELNSCQLIVDC